MAPALSKLTINDLRPRLSVVPNPPELVVRGIISRRKRRGPVLGATIHYNGPELSFRTNDEAVLNFIVNVDCPNHQQRIGMDSLAYHFVVLNSGAIWQTRDLELISWHCAHPVGNESTLAIHCP